MDRSAVIVVDLGCATYPAYPEDESIDTLIERFKPDYFYGFDPHPSVIPQSTLQNGSVVFIANKAAWIYDGFIGYTCGWNPLRAYTAEEAGPMAVPCFDLSSFIVNLTDGRIVLKMDVEGAEYALLPHLHETGADALLELLLIEWHGNEPVDLPFRCPIELW